MKKTNPYLVNKKKEKIKVNVIQVFVLISFILLWELLSIFNIIDSFLFSSPSSIIKLLIVYIKNGILFRNIYAESLFHGICRNIPKRKMSILVFL